MNMQKFGTDALAGEMSGAVGLAQFVMYSINAGACKYVRPMGNAIDTVLYQ